MVNKNHIMHEFRRTLYLLRLQRTRNPCLQSPSYTLTHAPFKERMTELQCRVCELKPQMIAINETCPYEGIPDVEVHLCACIVFPQDRVQQTGGGTTVNADSSLNPTRRTLPADAQQSPGFEATFYELHTPRCTLPLFRVYGSPSFSEDGHARIFRAK